MSELEQQPIRLFVSLSSRDDNLLGEFKEALAVICIEGQILQWDYSQIEAASEWETVLLEKLDSADIYVFLVSPAFFNSKYIQDNEINRALKRVDAGEAKALFVLVRDVAIDWDTSQFRHLQLAPSGRKPITMWSDRDSAWADVIRQLRDVIKSVSSQDRLILLRNAHGHNAVRLLYRCAAGMPRSVLEKALALDSTDLDYHLRPYMAHKEITVTNDLYRLAVPATPLSGSISTDILLRGLQNLCHYVEQHKYDAEGYGQLENVHVLASELLERNPDYVASVFSTLDKVLKNRGSKQWVKRLAELSIRASEHGVSSRSAQVLDAEARAYVCGLCWVHQRTGQLGTAEDNARKAEELAQLAGRSRPEALRTLAYAKKCRGRLNRMMGEAGGQGHEHFLRNSVTSLQEALAMFRKLGDPEEEGDCHSLLGRTYLVEGDLEQARKEIASAKRQVAAFGKDRIDLLLLEGDYHCARGEWLSASQTYKDAFDLSDDVAFPIREMHARALEALANSALKWMANSGQTPTQRTATTQQAGGRLDEAAEIYRALGDHSAVTRTYLAARDVLKDVPQDTSRRIRKESDQVKVAALRLYFGQQIAVKSSAEFQSNRAAPSNAAWAAILVQARERVARNQADD